MPLALRRHEPAGAGVRALPGSFPHREMQPHISQTNLASFYFTQILRVISDTNVPLASLI
jgi:hypothetical protein